ncbi:hypothetical protein BU14_0268s0003 [Porphyra umbilicalis]|uniref:Uncharacterized protein n=1 Tax=Porphyra umbilicalis TaxID=2786 RepID=A0A1X6P1M5_PORUM|nr:hypothetical protein BU14_0268s0003 [Porphyra umbilicalis]|eukprot:OSX74762.1 hypothetical protein BU14_0268s0003 [Porphyra umbilicalis]
MASVCSTNGRHAMVPSKTTSRRSMTARRKSSSAAATDSLCTIRAAAGVTPRSAINSGSASLRLSASTTTTRSP